jgi:hypothetical protein
MSRGVDGPHLEEALRYDGIAKLQPEADNQFDPNAVAVIVAGERVGYISKTKAPRVKRLIGNGIELQCTIFWNGNPNDDFQFYTVQLFS